MKNGPHLKLWSIGGGKGGVGKSIVTLALGITMARLGHQVILVDGDLGGANLHTMMGLRFPQVTLEDFLLRKTARLEDIVLPTPLPGLGLICGADDFLGAANPTHAQKMRLFNQLEELPADFVFIDLGAGTSFNTLDFFNYSPGKIAVFTGCATALQNVYGFIKCALFRKISREFATEDQVVSLLYNNAPVPGEIASMTDLLSQVRQSSPENLFPLAGIIKPYRLFLIPNMVRNAQDFRSPEIIQSVCEEFLHIKPEILGHIYYDSVVEVAINQMEPRLLQDKSTKIVRCFEHIARKILKVADKTGKDPAAAGDATDTTVLLSRTKEVFL